MAEESRGLAFDMCTKLLVAALEDGDWKSIRDKGVTEKNFLANRHARNAFKRIQTFYDQNGSLPSLEYISKAVPGFGKLAGNVELDSEDSVPFLVSSLSRLNIIDSVREIGMEIEDQLDGIDNLDYPTEDETQLLMQSVLQAALKLTESTLEEDDIQYKNSLSPDSPQMQNLDKLRKGEIERGVMTGIAPLDFITNGLSPSDFWTIIAFTNVGKSMLMCILALSLALMGYRVLFLTKEMQAEELWKRIVALQHRLKLGKMYSGEITDEEFELISGSTVENNLDVILSGVYGGIADIFAKVDKYEPQVLIVDSAYLFTDSTDDSKQGWEKVANVWRGLKQYGAMKGIPVIATTQSNTEKVSLNSISYAKQVRADSTVIIGMEEENEEGRTNQVMLHILKNRSGGKGGKFYMNWDFYEMDWDVVNADIIGYDQYLLEQKAKEQKKQMKEKQKGKKRLLGRRNKHVAEEFDDGERCNEPSKKGKELLSLFKRG